MEKEQYVKTLFNKEVLRENALFIESQEEAYALLEQLNNNIDITDDIVFGNWVNIKLYLRGDKFDSSLTPSMFPVFQALQRSVYRMYARSEYNNIGHRLSALEKSELEIIIKITSGSSDTQTGLNYTAIALALIKKMTPKQAIATIISLATLYAGYSSFGTYSEDRKQEVLAHERTESARVELEKFKFAKEDDYKNKKLLIAAARGIPMIGDMATDAEDFYQTVLKSSKHVNHMAINGQEISTEVAEIIAKKLPEIPKPMQINDNFYILGIDWKEPQYYMTLKRVTDSEIIKVKFFLDWLDDSDIEFIKNTEWKQDGQRIFYANINARVDNKNKIIDAELVKVRKQ